MMFSETTRRKVASIVQWLGWWGALALGFWAVQHYNPAEGHFAPQWVSLGYIFLVGVAIAASNARSRMKLSDTIAKAFAAGMEAHESLIKSRTDKILNEIHPKGNGVNDRLKPQDSWKDK